MAATHQSQARIERDDPGAGPKGTATIVVVDDDELILSTLRGLFLLETDYDLLAFDKPADALAEAERRPIDVVIADFLMPEMNGVQFLKRLRELQPQAVRILLTGFADKENAIRAINEVGLYQYIEKPWVNEDLLLLVRNAIQEKSLRQQLADRVRAFDHLIQEHTQLSDRHKSLERELEMAARVQRSLFPKEMPRVDGLRFAGYYHSCAALGGDYYDAFQTEKATILLLSDVSGHGVQAALTSMLLKAIFQDAAMRAAGPTELLHEMNASLHKYLPTGMYACASVAWLEPGSTEILFTNAGLPYPFVIRGSQGRLDEIPLGGLPLGLFEQTMPDGYDCRETRLEPGDVLLMASDGLGDVRNEQQKFFQEEVLRQALSELNGKDGQLVIEGLVERAQNFSGAETYPDDISMLAITRT